MPRLRLYGIESLRYLFEPVEIRRKPVMVIPPDLLRYTAAEAAGNSRGAEFRLPDLLLTHPLFLLHAETWRGSHRARSHVQKTPGSPRLKLSPEPPLYSACVSARRCPQFREACASRCDADLWGVIGPPSCILPERFGLCPSRRRHTQGRRNAAPSERVFG